MSVTEDKLKRFEQIIFSDVEKEVNAIVEETDAYKNKALAEYHEKMLDEYFDYMQEQVKKIKADTKRRISQTELETQREILMARNEIAARVFDTVKQDLTAFTEKEEYRAYLTERIQAAVKDADIKNFQILVKASDLPLLENSGFLDKIAPDDSIRLGGFILISQDDGFMVDESFDSKLDGLVAYFNRTSGLTVNH